MSRINNVLKNAKVGILFMMATMLLGMLSRKVFLDGLGADFLGMAKIISSIVGMLALAEIGLSIAVSSCLYAPLAMKDYNRAASIINFLGKCYRILGCLILLIAVLASVLLIWIFDKEDVDLTLVYFVYYVSVITVIVEYIFNYKQFVLYADQKNYIVTKYSETLRIFQICLQIIIVIKFENAFLWVAIGLFTTVIRIYLINKYVSDNYKWLTKSTMTLKELYKQNENVFIKTKDLAVHKIGAFVFNSSDTMLIYKFADLATIAIIDSYQILIGILRMLMHALTSGLTASIGNFVSEHDGVQAYKLFKNIWLLYWIVSSVLCVSCYFVIDIVIRLWLGAEYVVEGNVVFYLCLNLLFMIVRLPIDSFIQAYGLFHDRKAPFFEVVINILVSITAGLYLGVEGVLLGTFTSMFIVIILWKPYLFYTLKFKLKYKDYIKDLVMFISPALFVVAISCYFINQFEFSNTASLSNLVIVGSACVAITSLASIMLLILNKSEFMRLYEIMNLKFRKIK